MRARHARRAVLHHLAPRLEVRWQARARQRLVQRVPERELRTPVRSRVTNPRGEEPARQPLVAHASDVPRPAQHTQVDVEVDIFDPQPLAQLRRADAVSPRAPARHAAHRPDAPVVERAQPREQILGEAPALRTAKEDIDDQRNVYHFLGLE